MVNSISIIGGADGPTSIFILDQPSWLNIFGLIIVVLLLVPNIIYALIEKNQENKCTNKFMNVLEQIGRYGCMFLMIFNIGILEFGFSSIVAFLVYQLGSILLMIAYWLIWLLYFKKKSYWKQIALALIPTGIFLLSGIAMLHCLLIIFAVAFGIGHIYVTNKNRAC